MKQSKISIITPYLGMIVLIVSIGGIFIPKLGYILLLVFATLLIIAPFRGRWFCWWTGSEWSLSPYA